MASYRKLLPPDIHPETRKAGKHSDLNDRVNRLERPRTLTIISGSVSSSGSIVAGNRFTSTRTTAGQYVITFVTPMLSRPAVTLTTYNGVTATNLVGLVTGSPPTPNGFTVWVTNPSSGAYIDLPFDFIAVVT